MPSSRPVVVVNTSPLIYLSSINKIHILKDLFHEIFIPDAVRKEVLSGGKGSFGFHELKNESWIKAKKIKNTLSKQWLLTDLDEGEAELMVLAEELKAQLIIMDDKLGRRIAHLKGFPVVGTLRVLVNAKEKGIIQEIKPLLNKLKEAGFWFSEDIYRTILKQSKE
ncbi:MAG: DUF3368 domain-containing protein [Nitrospirae bacterium]|nr:DUF3368 domain-containing protein [Nitrospirota bacterium]